MSLRCVRCGVLLGGALCVCVCGIRRECICMDEDNLYFILISPKKVGVQAQKLCHSYSGGWLRQESTKRTC